MAPQQVAPQQVAPQQVAPQGQGQEQAGQQGQQVRQPAGRVADCTALRAKASAASTAHPLCLPTPTDPLPFAHCSPPLRRPPPLCQGQQGLTQEQVAPQQVQAQKVPEPSADVCASICAGYWQVRRLVV